MWELISKLNGYRSIFMQTFWKYADIFVLGAGFSTVIWCSVWLLGFFTLIAFSLKLGIPTETSALIISLTVLLGHLPKYVAMFVGTDTDFQDFRTRIGEFSLKYVPWRRFSLSTLLIAYLIYVVFPDKISVMKTTVQPYDLTEFVTVTGDNFLVCFLLFAIQFIFSYPEDVKDIEGVVL